MKKETRGLGVLKEGQPPHRLVMSASLSPVQLGRLELYVVQHCEVDMTVPELHLTISMAGLRALLCGLLDLTVISGQHSAPLLPNRALHLILRFATGLKQLQSLETSTMHRSIQTLNMFQAGVKSKHKME